MSNTERFAVLFDMDGTLLDTIADIAAAVEPVLTRRGFKSHQLDDYKKFVGRGLKNALINALPDTHTQSPELDVMYQELLDEYAKAPSARTTLYSHIDTILDELSRQSIPMSILSNKAHELTVPIVNDLLSRWQFVSVLGLSEAFEKKPDPQAALHCARSMGASAESTVLVGDSEVDYECALNARMRAVIVSWGFRTRAALLKTIPSDVIVDTPGELLARLLSYKQGF